MTKEKKMTPAAIAKQEKLRARLTEMSVLEEELYLTGRISIEGKNDKIKTSHIETEDAQSIGRPADSMETDNSSEIKFIAGVDEVGRGPLAGPVVAAAVILPRDCDILGIDDSKKISEKKRNELYDVITENAIAYSIGMVDNKRIDEINILESTKEAMNQAVRGLSIKPDFILIDALMLSDIEIPHIGIVKGDSKSISIAAASIVAKVTRDRMMIEYHEKYPYYAFDKNKGYGTVAHYSGIKDHGITPWHRRTFLKNLEDRTE